MIRSLLGLMVAVVVLSGCGKKFIEDKSTEQFNKDVANIKAYAATNNISLTDVSSSFGLLYNKSVALPDARKPKEEYRMQINYVVKVLNGSIITQKTPADSAIYFYYTSLVFDGFTSSVFLLNEGEKGTFYIPSPLAYGSNPPAGVPKDAIVVIEMEAVKFYTEAEQVDQYIVNNKFQDVETSPLGVKVAFKTRSADTTALTASNKVKVTYKGLFLNNTSFDSGTIDVDLAGSFIPGFKDGLLKMHVGDKAVLIFTSSLGYGQGTSDGSIPPFTPLAFDVEIVSKL